MNAWRKPWAAAGALGLTALAGCSSTPPAAPVETTPSASTVDEHMTAVRLATQAGLAAVDGNPDHEARAFNQSEAVTGSIHTNDAGGALEGDVTIFTFASSEARQQWRDLRATGGGYVRAGESHGAIWGSRVKTSPRSRRSQRL